MLYQMMFLGKEFLKSLGVDEETGQGLIEYALIVLLISIVVIAVLTILGGQVENVFSRITSILGAEVQ